VSLDIRAVNSKYTRSFDRDPRTGSR